MLHSPPVRAALLVLVLGALFGLLVWGGPPDYEAEANTFPNEYALALDYDAHVGQEVEVRGEVVSTDPLVLFADFQYQDAELTIVGADVDAEVGDTLNVFGVAEPDHRIHAIDAYTVPDWGREYAITISVLAGLWVFARLVRSWRVDLRSWGLRPRGGVGRSRARRDGTGTGGER